MYLFPCICIWITEKNMLRQLQQRLRGFRIELKKVCAAKIISQFRAGEEIQIEFLESDLKAQL